MSYYKMMKKIESSIETKSTSTKNQNRVGSGLLLRSNAPVGPIRATEDPISDQLADYIMSIRKQKEELIRGRK